MTFTIAHTRALSGNDLTVKVGCTGAESISAVTVTYDGAELADEELPADTESYERVFPGAGQAGPGVDHRLVVSAVDQDGRQHASVTSWTDVQ